MHKSQMGGAGGRRRSASRRSSSRRSASRRSRRS